MRTAFTGWTFQATSLGGVGLALLSNVCYAIRIEEHGDEGGLQGETQCWRFWTAFSIWPSHTLPPNSLSSLYPHRRYFSNVLRPPLTRRLTPCSDDFIWCVPRHLQHHQHDHHPHHVQPSPTRPAQRGQEGCRRSWLLHRHILHSEQCVSIQCILCCFLYHNHTIWKQAYQGELLLPTISRSKMFETLLV